MLCLAHNLGRWRTEALGLDVWRYRFDLVANNLNSLGASIGTFHGIVHTTDSDMYASKTLIRGRYPICYGVSTGIWD